MVIVIIAVLTGVAAFSINSTDARRINGEVAELRIKLNHLMTQALIHQQDFKWLYDPEQKRCLIYQMGDNGEWRAIANQQGYGCTFNVVENIDLAYFGYNNKSNVRPDLSAKNHETDKLSPTLYFFSSAEYTPFEMKLTGRDNTGFKLTGDGINDIIMKPISP
ncbi:MAG: hypothetical protein M0Q95_06340 [Porticoccaceae bacterium]|nr:hypothetical protein [Porticoccaceae bacterium]